MAARSEVMSRTHAEITASDCRLSFSVPVVR